MASSTRGVAIVRYADGAFSSNEDTVAIEEPLEIRISGETLAITMRTPGHDRELVAGFLLAEGVIASRADLATVTYCGRVGDEARENTIDVTLAPGVKPPIDDDTGMLARRGTITTSACGVCGRRSVDDLLEATNPLVTTERVDPRIVLAALAGLKDRQPIFAKTGGCHAASLVAFDGTVRGTHEDVGRHNAVDKVVGAQVLAGTSALPAHLLAVSGRSSFEIVQKAFRARIPVVAAVSAPSSLAIELARRTGVTLCGFVRGNAMTIYAGDAIAEGS